MAKAIVLIIEDDPDILELLSYTLGKEGYETTMAATGEAGLAAMRERAPDLVLLDVMLPGMDGFELLRKAKADPALARVPVLMVSARGEEADVVTGLELGAEDYVTKPFSPRVLVARARAALRRSGDRSAPSPDAAEGAVVRGPCSLDPSRHELLVDGDPVELSATEFAMLELLMRESGRVFTRAQMLDRVRGRDYPVTDRAVDVQILSIRRKLGARAELVETIRGVGYRFKDLP